MIYTVSLNPSLDRTLSVERLVPGAVHRARVLRQDVGGKGINVSRALAAIGLRSVPVAFLAGATGEAMRRGLAAAGFDGRFIEVAGETRQNITLLDESAGLYTKLNEPGPGVGPAHLAALRELVAASVQPGDLWAFCGSLPPAAPHDLYAELIALVQARGGLAVLDTSGPALRMGLAAGPCAVKPNSEEAGDALGTGPVVSEAECLAAAAALLRCVQANAGVATPWGTLCPVVCLTRGSQGLILASGDLVVIAEPPSVTPRSSVGAGDAALGGLIWAIVEGCGPAEAARRAVACGTAAAMQEGTGIGDRGLIERLLPQVQIRLAGPSGAASLSQPFQI